MSEDRVLVEVADHVATVTLNRPDKHNALDGAMFEAIAAAARRLAGEPGLRAVVLHGAGRASARGSTWPVWRLRTEGSTASGPALAEAPPNRFQLPAYGWLTLPVPVIAAIHGNCLGGGLQIALAADIRIAAPDARLSVMEVKWGLVPDMSLTRTLPRLVGIDVAKELTYTGRVVSGTEARELGLVTRLDDDPLAAAGTLAAEIAGRSPDAIRSAKRLLDCSWTAEADETLALEAELQSALIGSPNQLAAVAAGLNKQPAQFTDPRSR